jgi:hypothetical protein
MMDFKNLVTLAWMFFASIMFGSTNWNSWMERVCGKVRCVRSIVCCFERVFIKRERLGMRLIFESYF